MKIIQKPSPNFNNRPPNASIDMLIIHYTGMNSAEDALKKLTDGNDKNPVSSHYLIDEKGVVYQLVEENKRAWHAGVGAWKEFKDINSSSIGIELYNDGNSEFPEAQMQALEELTKGILQRNKINKSNVIGHSDIAPHRKRDPGHKFNWDRLAKSGLALAIDRKLKDCFNCASILKDEKKLKNLFNQAGYRFRSNKNPIIDYQVNMKQMVTAFQRRWQPNLVANNPEKIGKADVETVKTLQAVIRANKNANNIFA